MNTSVCNEIFHIGEYSCLKAEFYLQRSIGYHLVQSYLPTILIVVISWVSFWLNVEAIPARITLGVTTLLTISSKGSGIQNNLPPVSYVKAMDVWMGACTTFVFAALLEFIIVNYLWRKRTDILPVIATDRSQVSPKLISSSQVFNGGMKSGIKEEDSNRTTESILEPRTTPATKIRAQQIDRLCRIAFPCAFVAFCVIYWPYYLM
ncbi:glycine receptor subunit alpha-1-like [Limulus polyphemus]|uniref:Glycine receptor subunit alpha-1-like n=1 Tax=Limulus polyphemus TaxID=6850 RepID=A0ABM1RUG5_LIMPO|nr:glycine receptor subunit alpha-1-like [Limulus polyphemus]